MVNQNGVKVIGAKIVLDGVDECRENIRIINENMREFDGCLQSVWQNMERCNEALGEFNKQGTQAFGNGRQKTTDEMCGNHLTRREVCERTVKALLMFVERTSSEKGLTTVTLEEIKVLPDVAKVLLDASRSLPG